MALALLLPVATACGDGEPIPKPGPVETQADAGGLDASTVTTPDASCAGATCDAGVIVESPDAGPADGGVTDAGAPDAGPDVPLPLPVDLSAPPELLVRGDDFAVLRVGVERHEGFTGPVTLSIRGLPSEFFVADRSVSEGTSAAALVVSVSGRVGPGTRLDATLVATAEGRSTSRPLRMLVAGRSFALDPTFPVVPLGWTDGSRFVDVSPDGELLTAYPIANASWPSAQGYVLERHHADGIPDLTFGMLGSVTHPRPAVSRMFVFKALPTGGSLVAGTAADCHDGDNATPCTFLVSRHLATGMLDTSFGDEGVVSTRFPAAPRSLVKLLADEAGRVSVALTYYDPTQSRPYVYAVQRWEADGRPVAGFGTEGRATSALPAYEQRFDQLREALQWKDGTIVIAVTLFDSGSPGNHGLGFVRMDGKTGQAGWLVENSPNLHRSVATDGHGRFVSLLNTYAPGYDLLVQWYNEAGTRIYFGTGSTTMPPRQLAIGSANELFFDDVGTPYTEGQIEGGGGLAVVRFTRHGAVDPGFGTNGLVRLDARLNSVSGFIREPNGCLLAQTVPEPGLVRFWP
ncbi:hypothetical protein JYJ95_12760 [Corallococcus exiguus]|uniref:hypothetical protein n=1 Tax=Corallococcus exiguus TaxID=83462 RepID=UPI001A90981B|nr:hypothetical protein [Corallococcus exiguus]MBN8467387.1 hypothetical protein [Corallococcus exiguus]